MRTTRSYHAYVERGRRRFGNRFSEVGLARKFIPYYENQQRIKVRSGEFERTGTVSATTGWQPVFLLMHRSNASGSWDTLSERDEIIAVKRGRTYVPTA